MKIKVNVDVDNSELKKAAEQLKQFFKPGGQANRIFNEEALKTRDIIRADVFSGERLITGAGRDSMPKTAKYANLFKHRVTYNTKKQEIFLGLPGTPTVQSFTSKKFYSISQAHQLKDSPFNKISMPTSVTANAKSTLRVPSGLAKIYAPEKLNKNERLKQIKKDKKYFVVRPNQLKGSSVQKRYGAGGNSPIAFKREGKKLIPIGIFYDKANYDKQKEYEYPKIEKYTNNMARTIQQKLINAVRRILKG